MAKSASVTTSQPVPSQQRGLKRGGTTPPGGSKPQTYKLWLAHLLTSERHRKEFTATIQDASHPHFMAATKHAAAYAHGLPTQVIELPAQNPDAVLTGEQIAERVWQRLEQLAQVAPQDRRLQVVASIQGAEAILNAAEPAEVVK